MQETEGLRKAWGDKLCAHPNIAKERSPMGNHSDYVCTQCGSPSFSKEALRKDGAANQKLIDEQKG